MSGGIFVSIVEPGSIAAQSGVVVGDQLLEVRRVFVFIYFLEEITYTNIYWRDGDVSSI